jgi:RHS repeat-associated protein
MIKVDSSGPGGPVSYEYYPAGNVAAASNLTGRTTYTNDPMERLSAMGSPAGLFRFGYGKAGTMRSVEYPSGMTAEYSYDVMDRLTGAVYRTSGGVVRATELGYDAAGMIATNRATFGSEAEGRRYEYDGLDRLVSETVLDATGGVSSASAWQYDLVGNRTSQVVDGTMTEYGYVLANRLASWTGGGGALYDEAGNTTNIAYPDGRSLQLSWNGQYQLTAVATNGVEVEAYGYDTLGRRAWCGVRSESGAFETNFFLYDGPHVVADLDASGGVVRSYVWGPGIDNLLAIQVYTNFGGTTSVSSVFYAVKDHLNSVLALVDSSGQIVEQYRHDAWGRTTVMDGSGTPLAESAVGNRYLWQGREYSWKTGLYYFRARWYDPITGRWLSNDPIGIGGGLNQYVAFGDNPVNAIDPFGLDLILVGQGGGAGGLMMLAAQHWASTHPGQHQIIPVSTGEEAIRMMRANAISMGGINGLQIFTHGSAAGLYLWQGAGARSLYRDDICPQNAPYRAQGARSISDIDPSWFLEGSYVGIHGCRTAQGPNSFAQGLATHLGINVVGSNVGMDFSGVPFGRSGEGLPSPVPANYGGPIYLSPNPGGGYQVMRP